MLILVCSNQMSISCEGTAERSFGRHTRGLESFQYFFFIIDFMFV